MFGDFLLFQARGLRFLPATLLFHGRRTYHNPTAESGLFFDETTLISGFPLTSLENPSKNWHCMHRARDMAVSPPIEASTYVTE